MSYAAKLVMHLSTTHSSTRISELTDFPGVLITDEWKKKEKKTERVIELDEEIYPTLEAAVKSWKLKRGEPV